VKTCTYSYANLVHVDMPYGINISITLTISCTNFYLVILVLEVNG